MAWINTVIEIDGVTYSGHRQNTFFSAPYASGLEVGDSFKADGVTYQADEVSDLHGRGETLTIKIKEVMTSFILIVSVSPLPCRSDTSSA